MTPKQPPARRNRLEGSSVGRTQRGFLLPGFLMSPTGIMAAVIVALSLSNVLFYKLWQGVRDDYSLYQAKVEAASAQADLRNKEKIADAERNTGEVARLYTDHMADLERGFNSRINGLLRSNGNCETRALVARSTSGLNAPTTNTGPDTTSFEAVCTQLEKDCAKTTLQTLHLQTWVRRVCK